MGFNPVLFPDFNHYLGWPDGLRSGFALMYVTLLLILVWDRGKSFFAHTLDRRWPRLELVDLALVCSLATLWLFSSHDLHASAHRYFLPAVWCFPFLVTHLYFLADGNWKKPVAALVVGLVIFNLAATGRSLRLWYKPGYLERIADTPRLEGLLDHLRETETTHCFATFWLAYRITFATDEEIICSMPYNTRFLYWPLPYTSAVESAERASYVLTQSYASKFAVLMFEQEMKGHGIRFHKSYLEPFHIYQSFDPQFFSTKDLGRMSPDQLTLQTSEESSRQLDLLLDDDPITAWQSSGNQHQGQFLEARLEAPETLAAVTIWHLPGMQNSPELLEVDGYNETRPELGWTPLASEVIPSPGRFRYFNGRPNYLPGSQQIRFFPRELTALRLRIGQPALDSPWAMTGLELHPRRDSADMTGAK
jgi:hypothetical protein